MRVRLDAQGRPRPALPPNRPAVSSTTPSPTSTSPSPTVIPTHDPRPHLIHKPPRPHRPPSDDPFVPPKTHLPAFPSTRAPPISTRPPPLLSPTPPPHDDEHASDSGSSVPAEGYNSEDEHPASAPDLPIRTQREREVAFVAQLAARGLRIVEMRPDGNCLFRALAHAVWNDAEKHASLRAEILAYLWQERDYFSQFVAEDFVRYVRRKRRNGTHGNHLEMQAAAELYGRPIEVYAYSSTPANVIKASGSAAVDSSSALEPVRLSFHRGSHYNAVDLFNGPDKSVKRAVAEAAEQAAWRAADDARATENEIERAVLALSLVEATRGDHMGASASSSSAAVPSSVIALVNSGYSEESATEAYQVAGHGGLSEMIHFLTRDRFQPKQRAERRDKRAVSASLQLISTHYPAVPRATSKSAERREADESNMRNSGDGG